jgi:hypothetical protein
MSSPDLSFALAGFALGMLGIIWAEEIQILELRVQRWQPSWVRIPGYETLLRSRHYPWFVRMVAAYVVLLQVGPLLRALISLAAP